MNPLQTALFFSLIAALVSTLGISMVSRNSRLSPDYANLFSLGAAGALCGTIFLHALPEAFSLSKQAPVWLMAGFFSGLIPHYIIRTLFSGHEGPEAAKQAILPVLAIAVHSFIDGIIYTVTFVTSISIGVSTALGLILHKLPEGIIAFAILRHNRVSARMSLVIAFIAAALATPAGAIMSSPFILAQNHEWIGYMFAWSSGILLFVATGPLIQPLHNIRTGPGLAAMLAGLFAASVLVLVPIGGAQHSHEHVQTIVPETETYKQTERSMRPQSRPETMVLVSGVNPETGK